MNEELNFLLEEKIYQIQNDLKIQKIEPKTMAEFASVFYEKYKKNYNEKLLVQICKRTMNFYNEEIKEVENKSEEFIFEDILNEISKYQKEILNILKEKPQNTVMKDLEEDLELEIIEKQYDNIKSKLKKTKKKKPFFMRYKSWAKKKEEEYYELEKIKLSIEKYIENKKNTEKNRVKKKHFKELSEDLKNFIFEVDKEIGVNLATITYEDATKNQDKLRDYVYEVIIANLYNYFMKKQ